jgi:hypothetical protein
MSLNHLLMLSGMLSTVGSLACSTAVAAHRPLSDSALDEVNETIESRTATLVRHKSEADAVQDATRARDLVAAQDQVCRSAPNHGDQTFGESCRGDDECECGLTCQAGRCLGSSLSQAHGGKRAGRVEPPAIKDLKVGRETTQWLEREETTGQYQTKIAPTESIQQVSVRSHWRGALEGAGLGLLGGVLVGALTGGAATSGCSNSPACGQAAGAVAIGIGALGVLIGAIAGGTIGHLTTIEFDAPTAASTTH